MIDDSLIYPFRMTESWSLFFLVDTANACLSLISLAGNKSVSVAARHAGDKTASVAGGSWIAADTKPASFSTETLSALAPLVAAIDVVISEWVETLKNDCNMSGRYSR